MNGIVLADYPWPVRNGSNQRDAAIIECLRAMDELRIFTFASTAEREATARSARDVSSIAIPEPSGGPIAALERRVRILLSAAGLGATYPTTWPFADALAAVLGDISRSEGISTLVVRSFFAPSLPKFQRLGPTIIDAEDAEHVLAAELTASRSIIGRAVGRSNVIAMRSLIRRFYPMADEVWVPCTEDAAAVRDVAPNANIVVIPNVVAMGEPSPLPSLRHAEGGIFVGNLAYPPNRAAAFEIAEDILPLVRRRRPEFHVELIGQRAGCDVEAPGLNHLGPVDDLGPHYENARVAIVPVRQGTGPKLKVIEALSRGVPVVATPKGVSSLPLRDGREVLVGNTPDELADLVLAVLADDNLADGLAVAGRLAVESHFGMSALRFALAQSKVLQRAVA